jgi:hypothetical protein
MMLLLVIGKHTFVPIILTMKKIWNSATAVALALTLVFGATSCDSKEEKKEEKKETTEKKEEEPKEEVKEEKAEWPEMMAFHEYMSSTFHPSENGDLAPLKEKARAMADAAAAWQASAVPAGYPENVGEILVKLKDESAALADLIDSGDYTDVGLTNAIADLHDRFHEIVERCYHEEGHDHGHEHGSGEEHSH